MNWEKKTARRDERHLNFVIWCNLYERFYGSWGLLVSLEVQAVACYLFWAKSLHESMMSYCQFAPLEQNFVKLESKYKTFL